MPHESPDFMIIMAILIVLGVVATAIYYFFRFVAKTDYDHDIEKAKKEIAQSTSETAIFDNKKNSEKTASSTAELPKSLDQALSNTKLSLLGRIREVFSKKSLPDQEREALEEVLYTSDLGPKTVQRLLESIDEKLQGAEKTNVEAVRKTLRHEMLDILASVKKSGSASLESVFHEFHADKKPLVWMIVGVNGAGKTTTIGKLAYNVAKSGRKVMVAAGDTFRAAAGEQLKVWSDRAKVEIFNLDNTTDPSAVAYAACEKAKANDFDVVIIDTAGRLHTQAHLMEELRKMKRVIQKVIADGPHEVLLVLDANSGQNALQQAKQFNEILEVSGVILTKLDGSAKGGVAVGLASEFNLPIRLIGVGEGIEDLRPFQPQEFVDSII